MDAVLGGRAARVRLVLGRALRARVSPQLLGLLVASTAGAQQITLPQAIDMALKQSHQAIAATATLDASRANARAFYARRLPQLSLTGNAPIYTKDIQAAPQPDGSLEFLPVQQTRSDAGLRIDQQLPWTGASFSVTSSLQRVDQTRAATSTRTWTGTPVQFQIQQPLFRPNAQRWDGRIQHLDLDVAERRYLEAREGVALAATEAFFELNIAKRSLENATANAATNDTLYNLNKGRLEIGKIGENDLLQSELALLRAQAALDNARLEYERRLAGFRLAVNLPPGANVDVVVPTDIPDFLPDTAVAVAQALKNRAQVSELALQDIQARRQISNARFGAGNGPGASLIARVGYNQIPGDSLLYRDLLQSQGLSLALNIPVFSFGARSADVQEARVNHKRVEATNQQGRRQLEIDARFAALQFSQSRRNLTVSAKSDTVAQKRFEVAYNRYVIGRIGIDNLYIAQNEKDQAVTQYLQALRNYWMAYYRLRQTTLYDFEAGVPIR
jgi:outer membrane protein